MFKIKFLKGQKKFSRVPLQLGMQQAFKQYLLNPQAVEVIKGSKIKTRTHHQVSFGYAVVGIVNQNLGLQRMC